MERNNAKCYDDYFYIMGFGENFFFLLNFFLYEFPKSSVRHVSSFYDQKELKAIYFLVLTHFTISLFKGILAFKHFIRDICFAVFQDSNRKLHDQHLKRCYALTTPIV